MSVVAAPQFETRIPDGDSLERQVCTVCGHIDYQNPKIIVGSVVSHDGRVLLCRRAIEPRRGFWTLPAGYLELGETAEQGARREATEEACADIVLDGVLGLFSIARIGQVQIIFRAGFAGLPQFAAGPESADVALFAWADIPWAEIAFPSVHWSLAAWRQAEGRALGVPAGNPPEALDGSGAPPGMANVGGL
jgi:ADP-ribose pyrophosphatase YjhB (NUDIX family)